MPDVQLNPPLRIQSTATRKTQQNRPRLSFPIFLDDYQERHASSRTQGDNTIIAQLQKLADALTEEQAMRQTK